jgi:hypothetical protein
VTDAANVDVRVVVYYPSVNIRVYPVNDASVSSEHHETVLFESPKASDLISSP